MKVFKRVAAAALALALLAQTTVYANTATREVTYGVSVMIDGEVISFAQDQRPFISNDRTYLPLRAIADALGFDVDFIDGTVVITTDGTTPTLPTAPTPAPTPAPPAQEQPAEAPATGAFTPGTFSATVPSWQDAPLTADVTFDADGIVSISIDHGDTPMFFDMVEPALTNLIVETQSTAGIDVTANATTTHNAIIEAVEAAIAEASN